MRFPVSRQRFPFTITSEIIAATSGPRRKQLLRVCRTLCIEPRHKVLRFMVNRFENSLPPGSTTTAWRASQKTDKGILPGYGDI
jgi:hypothetical protein